jgi:hypothetical protein
MPPADPECSKCTGFAIAGGRYDRAMTRAVGSLGAVGGPGEDAIELALETAGAYASSGRRRDAIAFLNETNRRARSPLLEIALVALRQGGFDDAVGVAPRTSASCESSVIEVVNGVPRVAPEQLRLGALEQGLARFGCLLVPGLLTPGRVQHLVDGIDRTFDEFDRWEAQPNGKRDTEAEAWFSPFQPVEPVEDRVFGGRMFTRSTGGIWTVESPRMLFEVIEALEQVGLGALIAGYFGEQPVLSAAKCNLRRTPTHIPGGWHQDGSFLGRDIATLDVWIALSDCGRDAPGLDIVPQRIEYLLEPGLDGVVVPHDTVLDAIATLDAEIASPEYHAGDVLLFDHMFLHRTAVDSGMTRERYALETWFFAPSRYPDGQIPITY